MAIGVDQFPILSFQQANPLLAGIQAGQQIYGQGVQNQFLRPTLQQQLQQMQLNNAAQQIKNQYLAPQLQAGIGLTEAQTNAQNALPGLYGAEGREALARAALSGAQSNLLNQQTPYLVAGAEGDVFKDPIMRRLFEYQKAQQMGVPLQMLQGGMAPQGNNQSDQSQQMTPGFNGNPLTAPKLFNGDALSNWAMFGSPYNPIQYQALQKQAETQASTGVTQYQDAQNTASQTADNAVQMERLAEQFKEAYDKSFYKGARLGQLPSSGIFSPPGNLSPEQQADQAAANLQAMMAKQLGSAKLTNQELNFARTLKVNRGMTPDTINKLIDILGANATRNQEYQQFLNASKAQGLDVQTANTVWNRYQNQRPLYDFNTDKVNKQYQGTWQDYLTPQSINAATAGKNYIPIPKFGDKSSFQNWYSKLSAPDQIQVKLQMGAQ